MIQLVRIGNHFLNPAEVAACGFYRMTVSISANAQTQHGEVSVSPEVAATAERVFCRVLLRGGGEVVMHLPMLYPRSWAADGFGTGGGTDHVNPDGGPCGTLGRACCTGAACEVG